LFYLYLWIVLNNQSPHQNNLFTNKNGSHEDHYLFTPPKYINSEFNISTNQPQKTIYIRY